MTSQSAAVMTGAGTIGPITSTTIPIRAFVAAAIFAFLGLILLSVELGLVMALGMVDTHRITVDPADAAIARQAAGYGYVLVAAGVLNVIAAIAVLERGAVTRPLALIIAGVGLGLSLTMLARMLLAGATTGAGVGMAVAAAVAYGVVLVALATSQPNRNR